MPLFLIALVIPLGGALIGVIASMYIIVRFSLIFPATAIDKGLTFRTSWVLSKNHKLLMLYVLIMVPLFFAIPAYLINLFTDAFWITSSINIIATVFTISFLSLAYKEICKYEYAL